VQGIVLNPDENQEDYEWGLGLVTNNQAEVLSLFQGIKLLDSGLIKNFLIIGDSIY